ncbi:MAG: LPS assembly protein LptD [Deltaproteobacteria bacterium]|nr:LPS assembly protein LptD [Deltaproteobacteria bacterium]
MKSFRDLLILILLLIPHISFGFVETKTDEVKTEILVEAEILEYDKNKGVLQAYGDVYLVSDQRIFRAQAITYDENSKEIFAQGNVFLQDGEDTISCEKLYFDLDKKTGHIENGRIFIKKGNYHIQGRLIEKRGENKYCVKKGSITTCEPDRPDWRFTAENADIVVGGYAKLTGTRFRVLDVPLFFLPWGMFPVKTERETGLLMPEIRVSSRDGFVFSPSLFWAIDRDKDATFFLSYIEERGIKPAIEFRYALREDKKGEWFSSIFEDKKYNHTRYEIKGEHSEKLIKNVLLKAKANYVSDIDYLKDFGERHEDRSESLLKSNVYVEGFWGRAYFTGEASYLRDLRQKHNDYTFKHLPFISFFTDKIPFFRNRFFVNLNSDFVNFYREKGIKYSRFNVEPSLFTVYSISGFNLMLSGNYYGKLYFMEKGDTYRKSSEEMQIFKIEGSLNTHFQRNYRLVKGFEGEVQSLIKPQIRWAYVPKRSFRDIPYIDPSDRLLETNILTYSLGHYLNMRGPSTYEISTIELEQSYSLYDNLEPSTLYEGYGRRFSDIKGRLKFYGIKNLGFTNESVVNIYGDGIRKMTNEFSYSIGEEWKFLLSHSYTKRLSHEIYFDIKAKFRDFYGKYGIKYSFFNHEWIDTVYEITYSPLCWSVTLRISQTKRPKDTSVRINFDLKGITGKGN